MPRDQIKKWKIFFKEDDLKGNNQSVIIDETEVLVYTQSRLMIPEVLRTRAVQWYHHYLQHPDISRLKETLIAVMFWPGIRADVRQHEKSCNRCQLGKRHKQKDGHVPPKIADQVPWQKYVLT